MPTRPLRSNLKHTLECLEDRIAPANVVGIIYDAGTGAFNIVGSDGDDNLQLFQTGKTSYRLEALGDTVLQVNDQTVSAFDFTKLAALSADLGDGADQFTIENLSGLFTLDVKGGAGNDVIKLRGNTSVKANTTIELGAATGSDVLTIEGLSFSTGGNFSVTAEGGSSVNVSTQSFAVKKDWLFVGGTSSAFVDFSKVRTLTVGGGTALNFRGPFDAFSAGDETSKISLGKFAAGEWKGASLLAQSTNGLNFYVETKSFTSAGYFAAAGGAGSGNITVEATESLQIKGKDAEGYSAKLTHDGTTGFNLQGRNVTLAGGLAMEGAGNGVQSFYFGGGQTVKVGKASDGTSFNVTGLKRLSGNFVADNLTLAGSVEVVQSTGGGVLELKGGASLTVGANAEGQSVKFTGTPSATNIEQRITVSGLKVAMKGGLDLDMGSGNNRLDLDGDANAFTIGKAKDGTSLKYRGGLGRDLVTVDGRTATFAGSLDVNLTPQDTVAAGDINTFRISSGKQLLKVGKGADGLSLNLRGGAAQDSAEIYGDTISLAGGVKVDLATTGAAGAESNSLTFTGSSVNVGATGGYSLDYAGGPGMDTVQINADFAKLAGAVRLDGPGLDKRVTLETDVASIGKGPAENPASLSVTGGGQDVIYFNGSSLTLASSLVMSGSTRNYLNLRGAEVSIGAQLIAEQGLTSISVGTGASATNLGADINVDRLTLAGQAILAGQSGNNYANVFVRESISVNGALALEGGSGTDTFTIESPAVKLGSLIVQTRGGADTIRVKVNGQVAGDAILDLEANASGNPAEVLELKSFYQQSGLLKVGGDLFLGSSGAGAATLTLQYVTVAGELELENGDGVGTFNLDGLTLLKGLTLSAGGGADVVNFERASQFGVSKVAGVTNINLGGGDDTLAIGQLPVLGSYVNRVEFTGAVTLDGGDGTNTLDPDTTAPGPDSSGVNKFAGGLTFVNFGNSGNA